ncbi:MAG: peptidoglycan bridge formation glycyltransferase FemA/FemB family protein, partial [bacterium]|nr:peptidoglycan bridge formation glycyltransferase FemA/FemB family protein [bacterium]
SEAVWDAFVCSQPDYTFLDAWAWGSFQEAMGSRVWRLGIFADDTLVGAGLVILVAARRGRFLFVPHGPIVESGIGNDKSKGAVAAFIEKLKDLAAEERCSFIRVSPLLPDTKEHRRVFDDLGFRRAPIHMHAEATWVLDLTVPLEQLLKDMRKTTRYLVRKAEKDGVTVSFGNDAAAIEDFCTLYRQTARRQRFVPFTPEYIEREMAAFGPEHARVALARHEGRLASGAIIIDYGTRAFYHHGASVQHRDIPASSVAGAPSSAGIRSIPASYLVQWAIVQDAKARGIKEYNFWGVDFRPNHPWSGVTLFKTGFGGSARSYVPTQDLPLGMRYWANFLIETARRRWRRY